MPLVQDQINDLAGVDSPIEVKVFGPDFATLRTLAEKVGKIVEEVPGAADVNPHVFLGNPDIVVRPDSVQTARVGLTEMDVESQLNAALYGQVASTVPEEDRMTKIRVRYPDRVRYDRDHLALLPISLATATPATGGASHATSAGVGFVPLGQLATIRTVRSPNEMWRENQQPVINVTAELEGRDLGSFNRELRAKLADLHFPPGYRWELAGSYRAQQEAFASLLTVFFVAAALVFLLLGFQFRSVILPIRLFLVQPISLVERPVRALDHGHAAERLVVHGGDLADRSGREERNHPDRVHRPASRGGGAAARGPDQGRSHPVPSDPHDQPLHDPGACPSGSGHGTGRTDATAAGDRRHRRPDHQHAPDPALDPGRIPGICGTAGGGPVVSALPSLTGGSMARILVVEDQEKHRDSLRRGLEAEGYDVVTASSGIEGFDAATTRRR